MTEKIYKNIDGEQLELNEQEYAEYYTRKAAYETEAPKRNALAEIARLEAEVTQRRLREAMLGTDNGWLENQDELIAIERARLA